ncbi:unnamed protein product [Prunus brigantina]
MKIKDEKEMETAVVNGNGTETGHIIVTTIGGRNGQPKQAKCLETGEIVAIKKVGRKPTKESHAFLVFLISHKSWCSIWEDPSVGNCHQITSPIFSFVITI